MELPRRSAVLDAVAAQIVPSILLLFLGLKPLYASRHVNKPDLLTQAREQEEDQNGKKSQQSTSLSEIWFCVGDSIAKRVVTEWFLYFVLTEEIPSDEDEVTENQQQQQASPPGQSGAEDDDEDDYWDDDGFEGTPLEEYSTPLDFDNGEDEYLFFTSTLLRMSLVLLSNGFNVHTHAPIHTHTHSHAHTLTDGFFSHARTPELWCSLVPLADGSTEWRPKETAAGDLQHLTTEKFQPQGPVIRVSGQ